MLYRITDAITALVIAGLALMVVGWINSADAQELSSVTCFEEDVLHASLLHVFGEVPFRVEGDYELWINAVTGTYTELWYPNDGTACIIKAGMYERLG